MLHVSMLLQGDIDLMATTQRLPDELWASRGDCHMAKWVEKTTEYHYDRFRLHLVMDSGRHFPSPRFLS